MARASRSGSIAKLRREASPSHLSHGNRSWVPHKRDTGHRFFEVMAAGVPQVVFGDPGLVSEHRHLAERSDVFWASTIEELEVLVLQLLAEPQRLEAIPVAPPPYWELKDLFKAALTPSNIKPPSTTLPAVQPLGER